MEKNKQRKNNVHLVGPFFPGKFERRKKLFRTRVITEY